MNQARKLFGTDGIRGRAGEWPMTPELALRVGMAVAAHFGRHGRVVVGKDTRRSGYMFENALSAGLCAMGADVLLVGPMPTPAIAHLAQSMRADAGVVISASHNPFGDNGIKLFAHDGFKLPDEVEIELEGLIEPGVLDHRLATGDAIGRAARIDDAMGRYISHLKHAFPTQLDLDGLKIVVDCAHGAAYKIAPTVLAELARTSTTAWVRCIPRPCAPSCGRTTLTSASPSMATRIVWCSPTPAARSSTGMRSSPCVAST
jgi:phosphoglucosamine mutase